MSEVHRYRVVTMLSAAGATIGYDPHGPDVVMAADFDRVTAELKRQLDHKEQQRESELRNGQAGDRLVGELQQRLTAADERVDVLEGLLRRVPKGLGGLNVTTKKTLWDEIQDALKPAEGGGDA